MLHDGSAKHHEDQDSTAVFNPQPCSIPSFSTVSAQIMAISKLSRKVGGCRFHVDTVAESLNNAVSSTSVRPKHEQDFSDPVNGQWNAKAARRQAGAMRFGRDPGQSYKDNTVRKVWKEYYL
jgi:hypothetical protein